MIYNFELITRADQLGRVAQYLESSPVRALDIETTALNPRDGEIRLVQFNTGERQFIIDLFQTRTLGPIETVLGGRSGIWICQNARFEQRWLYAKYGIQLWPLFDTWRASMLLHNGKFDMEHHLYALYDRELGVEPKVPDMSRSDWSGPLSDMQLDYAIEDVEYLHPLRLSLRKQLQDMSLNRVALLEFGAILPEVVCEVNGLPFNKDMWIQLAEDNAREVERQKAALFKRMPNPHNQMALPGFASAFNLNSPKEVLRSFAMLGIELEDTKDITLAMIADKEPVVKAFQDYRGVSKYLSAFGLEYLKWVNPDTGRIHPQYWPFTGAGRYANSKPNCQQLPRDLRFRSCFRPGEGKKLIAADYAGIEMRICAEVAGDTVLINDVFKKGIDVHYYTASMISGRPIDAITRPERQQAKPLNFGLIYGLGWEKLISYAKAGYGVTLTTKQSKTFRQKFFEGYPGIQRWQTRAIRDGARRGWTRTLGGRIRYFPNGAHNQFFNTPVQGTGADALKLALRNVFDRLDKYDGRARLIHHVHDEIILETDDDPDLIHALCKDLEEGMTEAMQVFLRSVPVEVESKVGDSWAELK